MVEENHLSVVLARDLHSLGAVAWWVHIWVDVDHFSVPFVSEKQALVIVSVHPEVR